MARVQWELEAEACAHPYTHAGTCAHTHTHAEAHAHHMYTHLHRQACCNAGRVYRSLQHPNIKLPCNNDKGTAGGTTNDSPFNMQLPAGQTTGNIWAQKYYIFSINDLPYRPPLKKSEKSRKKFQAKAIQGHVPPLNLIFFSRSVFHNMQITSEPLCSDPCARLKIQISMHSISWGCPQLVRHCDPISLLINTFGIHLQPGWKSCEQIVHYHTAKNVKIKWHFGSIFRRIFINWPRRDFL